METVRFQLLFGNLNSSPEHGNILFQIVIQPKHEPFCLFKAVNSARKGNIYVWSEKKPTLVQMKTECYNLGYFESWSFQFQTKSLQAVK